MAILVTGGTKGIGFTIAHRFAKPGTDVFLNYHSDEAAATNAKQKIDQLGARAHLIRADVGTPSGASAAIDQVKSNTDRLDQLVHCAVHVIAKPALEADLDDFTRAVNLNGNALLYLVQAALPLLQRGSRIVIKNYAAVGVGKALAESLVRYLAVELAPRGVRINAVAPGAVDTDALRAVFGAETDKILQHSVDQNPSGRSVQHDDYSSLIEYLASPAADSKNSVALGRLDPVHLSIQPHATAGMLGACRLQRERLTARDAGRRREIQGCVGTQGCACV